ncbi:MAG: tol-pal system protein YbgF [Deltaproteobacteria bacterium]|nr:tol-pal system protein YbgF [Deltaproteobacteria bacterium]
MNLYKRYLTFVPVLLATGVLSGCGPGFPIITAEQERLTNNVTMLLQENESLKSRVSVLEGSGAAGISELRQDMDTVKTKLAETNANIEKLRQDFSFINGTAQEAEHDRNQIKESLKSINSGFDSVNQKLSALEQASKDNDNKLTAFKTAIDENDKKMAGLKEAVASLDKKTTDLESRSIKIDAPATDKNELKETPDALYSKGYKAVVDKDFPGANEIFQRFLSSYPTHRFAGNAQYWIAEIYYAKNDWEMAILEFDKVIKKYPDSEKAAPSLLKQGFAFEKIGSKKEAKAILEQVIEKYPKSHEAGMAKKRLEAIK